MTTFQGMLKWIMHYDFQLWLWFPTNKKSNKYYIAYGFASEMLPFDLKETEKKRNWKKSENWEP